MGDVFKEQIVKRASTGKDFAIKVALVILVVVIFFASSIIIPSFAFVVIAASVFGAYYLMSFFNVEYEYVFTNGELDIDAIYSKTRRKRLFSGDIRNVEIMARVNDKMHIGDFKSAAETKDCTSGKIDNNTFAFLTTYKGKKVKFIFEPNEMMLKAISTVLTSRKLFK